MPSRSKIQTRIGPISVVLGLSFGAGSIEARGQDPAPASPILPPPPATPPASGPSKEAELEARVRQLEAVVQQLSSQIQQRNGSGMNPSGPVVGPSGRAPQDPAGVTFGPDGPTAASNSGGGATAAAGSIDAAIGSHSNAGPSIPPLGAGPNPSPRKTADMPPLNRNDPAIVRFGPGFELTTYDDEYILQFHDLTQIDFRGYQQGGQSTVRDTFAIPRQWFIFTGRLTRPYEYYLALQNAFDTVNLVDTFVNVHYDDRLQFKIGRYKTPFTYEFYVEPTQGLIDPEFSVFFNNFGLNRQVGAMAWGRVLPKLFAVDYAAGIYNQGRNQYLSLSDNKDLAALINVRPFAWLGQDSALEGLNVGGSVFAGTQENAPLTPATLRTEVATGNAALGVPFLGFNGNVRENGPLAFWDLHAAYYYRSLSLIAEWQSGYDSYSMANTPADRTKVPVASYYVQAGYFLTGETVLSRNIVAPKRPFEFRKGKSRGPGAIELAGRYQSMVIGKDVFTSGFADPTLWTNSLNVVDSGLNWYPTQYTKLYFGWEGAYFGEPVFYAPNRRQTSSDTFWFRFQVFF